MQAYDIYFEEVEDRKNVDYLHEEQTVNIFTHEILENLKKEFFGLNKKDSKELEILCLNKIKRIAD